MPQRLELTHVGHGRTLAFARAEEAAGRLGVGSVGSGDARGTITRRSQDGRYAFAEIDSRLEVELEPAPAPDGLAELLAKAERDCFIAASLTVTPRYEWTVNGADAHAAA